MSQLIKTPNQMHLLLPISSVQINRVEEARTFTEFSQVKFRRNLMKLGKTEEFEGVNLEKFKGNYNGFLVASIMESNELKLYEINKISDASDCAFLPTIGRIILIYGKKKVREIFAKALEYLCRSNEVSMPKSKVNMANQFMHKFFHLTLLDLICFCEEAKGLEGFKIKYQSITTRGITPEFLSDWIAKFKEKRNEKLEESRSDFKDISFLQKIPTEMKDKLERFVLKPFAIDKTRKINEKSKLFELTETFKKEQSKRRPEIILIEQYAFQVLKFQSENFLSSNDELIAKAKSHCTKTVSDAMKIYDELPPPQSRADFKNDFIQGLSKRHKELANGITCESVLHSGLEWIAKDVELPESVDVFSCVNKLIPEWNKQYAAYFQKELNENRIPATNGYFNKIKAVEWLKNTKVKSLKNY